MHLSDGLALLAVVVAIGTYVGTSRRERAIRRAELIHMYTAEFYGSEEIYSLFADLDYDRFSFSDDRSSWLGAAPERAVVHMLDLFNSLGLNWYRGVISTKDIQGTTLGYAMLRARDSTEMRSYLEFVHGHDQDHLGTGVPFEFFQRLAGELQVVSSRTRDQNHGGSALLEPSGRLVSVPGRIRRQLDVRR